MNVLVAYCFYYQQTQFHICNFVPLIVKILLQFSKCLTYVYRYKAKYPENTILAFQQAVKAGADCVETDVRLTKDEVVCILHDRNLNRVFGVDVDVRDLDYELDNGHFRTIQEPHEPLPTYEQFLHELTKHPGVNLLVDIKPVNDLLIIPRMVDAMLRVNSDLDFWKDKVSFCLWSHRFIPACDRYAPSIPLYHIGFNFAYAERHFVMHPRVKGVSMAVALFLLPHSQDFVDLVHAQGKQVFAWTLNTPSSIYLALIRGCDGLLSDDPVMARALSQGPIVTKSWHYFHYSEWLHMIYGFLRAQFVFFLLRTFVL